MNAIEQTAVKGKYGWHPCDVATFAKLKAIHRAYWESVYRLAAYHRWERKAPQNRVQKYEGKGADGKRLPLNPHRPINAPAMTPFMYMESYQSYTDGKGNVNCKNPFTLTRPSLLAEVMDVVQDYQNARQPKAKPEEVFALRLTTERIDALYAKITAEAR